LARDFSKISALLVLPEKDSRNQTEIVDAVRSWLNQNPKWLLIFDNAKEPSEVGKYIPESTLGDVLITSRNPNWRGIAEPISVKELERAESIDFLCRRTGRKDEDLSAQLAEAPGDLPLDLEQAGAYIESRNKTFQSYLVLLSNYQKDLLSWRPKDAPCSPAVAATWEASFNQAKMRFLRAPISSI
jgi:hypothetical protein